MALLKVLLLLLGLGVAMSSVSLQKRIIGGQNCRDDERHYHVEVSCHKETLVKFCGGNLISDQWILTAAHCWMSEPGWVNKVHLAVHPRRDKKLTYLITHGEVYRDRNSREHDIMLLKLPAKITTIRPIKLPDCPDTLLLGTKVQIAGYGFTGVGNFNKKTVDFCRLLGKKEVVEEIKIFIQTGFQKIEEDEHRPDVLQCAELKIDKHEKMEKILAKYKYFKISYQEWYSVSSSKKDVSHGDSGGGFVFNNRLYGVSSFSGDPWHAFSAPSAFMDVCAYKQWIDDTIN